VLAFTGPMIASLTITERWLTLLADILQHLYQAKVS
jgi:hypothetical protein